MAKKDSGKTKELACYLWHNIQGSQLLPAKARELVPDIEQR